MLSSLGSSPAPRSSPAAAIELVFASSAGLLHTAPKRSSPGQLRRGTRVRRGGAKLARNLASTAPAVTARNHLQYKLL